MHVRRVITSAVLGVALLALAAPAAATTPTPTPPTPTSTPPTPTATTPPEPTGPPHPPIDYRDEPVLAPWRVAAGGRVTITSYCANKNGITAESPVFGKVTLTKATKDKRGRYAIVTVRADAKPGRYTVHVRCPAPDGGELAYLDVLAPQTRKPQTRTTPKGGAETGAGGAIGPIGG